MADKAENQAEAQLRSIIVLMRMLDLDFERLKELRDVWVDKDQEELDQFEIEELEELEELIRDADGCESYDDVIERLDSFPLSAEVRSGWHGIHQESEPAEYRIVLCAGGPHVEIEGDLNAFGEPCNAKIIYKDWGTEGELPMNHGEHNTVVRFASHFIYGV